MVISFSQTLQCYCDGSTICSWDGSVCENEITWILYVTFIQKMLNFCIDCTYLSVNRVNAIGENSNFSSQLRTEFHCVSPIPYNVFLSCDHGQTNKLHGILFQDRYLNRTTIYILISFLFVVLSCVDCLRITRGQLFKT